MIYVISNVDYPESRKLRPEPGDLLVFLNKARSAGYYRDHARKMCVRRSPKPEYGNDLEDADNRFIFSGPPDQTIPGEVVAEIKKNYDFDYEIEAGKARCPTTGYMAVKWLEKAYPGEEIVLVNFGYEVGRSSYRCPWHNWRFEDKQLGAHRHIYTADMADHDRMEVVYCGDANYLDRISMSAESVLRHNPRAHITVVSPTPLELPDGVDGTVFDLSGFGLRTTKRLSAATYLRLFLPDVLPFGKVIYLDGDTLCRGSLNELWRKNVSFLGACHSHDFGRKQAEQIGIDVYHISAVLLMDLDALRAMKFTTIAAFAAGHFVLPKTRFFCDETILNACFDDLIETLPLKWCYCVNRSYNTYDDKTNDNTAAILHYIGGQTAAMKRGAEKML